MSQQYGCGRSKDQGMMVFMKASFGFLLSKAELSSIPPVVATAHVACPRPRHLRPPARHLIFSMPPRLRVRAPRDAAEVSLTARTWRLLARAPGPPGVGRCSESDPLFIIFRLQRVVLERKNVWEQSQHFFWGKNWAKFWVYQRFKGHLCWLLG